MKRKILVIDDDRDIRDTLLQILEFEGYTVAGASNGQEGLELLPVFQPETILLDLMMPVMSGAEFRTKQISLPEFSEIPVVLLSADSDVPGKATALGINYFLKKPVEIDTLLETLSDSFLRRKDSAQLDILG